MKRVELFWLDCGMESAFNIKERLMKPNNVQFVSMQKEVIQTEMIYTSTISQSTLHLCYSFRSIVGERGRKRSDFGWSAEFY